MNTDFKPDELIFLIDKLNFIRLAKFVTVFGFKTVEAIDIDSGNEYYGFGFAATPENRQALVTLYSEETVPKIPLRGSELTKKLLGKQKYVLCFCSDTNEDDCRENKYLSIITCFEDGYFYDGKAVAPIVTTWKYAVPVDMNGNEITEYEV